MRFNLSDLLRDPHDVRVRAPQRATVDVYSRAGADAVSGWQHTVTFHFWDRSVDHDGDSDRVRRHCEWKPDVDHVHDDIEYASLRYSGHCPLGTSQHPHICLVLVLVLYSRVFREALIISLPVRYCAALAKGRFSDYPCRWEELASFSFWISLRIPSKSVSPRTNVTTFPCLCNRR